MLANSGSVFAAEELAELRRCGAEGDVCPVFFDKSRKIIRTPLDDRFIGITLERLHRVPRVVAVADGKRKVTAIRAALLGRHANVPITDKFTVAEL